MSAIEVTPRLLSKAQAAAYCGLTACAFDKWRKAGKMPDPLPGTARWDKVEIDRRIDDLSKLSGLTGGAAPSPAGPSKLEEWQRRRHERKHSGR